MVRFAVQNACVTIIEVLKIEIFQFNAKNMICSKRRLLFETEMKLL